MATHVISTLLLPAPPGFAGSETKLAPASVDLYTFDVVA